MIMLFLIAYFGLGNVVEMGSIDDEEHSANEELDEKPRIRIWELFKYKVSYSYVVLLVWTC